MNHMLASSPNQPMIIDGVAIRMDAGSRYCLNDLHKAAIVSGANKRTKEPSKWLASPQTVDLIKEIDTQNLGIAPIESRKGGLDQGTYVCKELVYAYAMWISAAYHLKVIRAFDTLQTQGVAIAEHAANDFQTNPLKYFERLLDQAKQLQVERDQAIATKAQISSSREASVMGKLSAASRKMQKLEQELGRNSTEATMIAVEKAMSKKFGGQGFRPLKKWCKDNGVTPSKVPCPRYGEVVAWPAAAWMDCYGVNLTDLFGKEGEA